MRFESLFQNYELIVDRADRAFQSMEKEFGELIKCRKSCSDCCYAVFGLFLIEAVYIKSKFDLIDPKEIQGAVLRCSETERSIKRLEMKLRKFEYDPVMQSMVYATERIRCPLLDDNNSCVIYPHRPITCRVYGIPTKIQGKARACVKSGFKSGDMYPVFDLDRVYKELFILSVEDK